MQRVARLFVGPAVLGALAAAPGASAQAGTGAALWRVAGTTLPLPPALATGAAATLWNPAQRADTTRTTVALEAIQAPVTVGATGVLAALRVRVRRLGHVAVVYGRVGLTDIARTGTSPDPVGGVVPVFTQVAGVNWTRALEGRAPTLGATLARHHTRLDAVDESRWTLDVGVAHEVVSGLRVAAATHFLTTISVDDPAQDLYAAIEGRVWRGPLWGGRAAIVGRYGIAFGHGFPADHWVGAGFALGEAVAVDIAVAREGGYEANGWRPIGGVQVGVGRYRVTLARDAGVGALGSAYRVGVEARFP